MRGFIFQNLGLGHYIYCLFDLLSLYRQRNSYLIFENFRCLKKINFYKGRSIGCTIITLNNEGNASTLSSSDDIYYFVEELMSKMTIQQ